MNSQHRFSSLQSSSQATLICYRGPGCVASHKFTAVKDDPPPNAKTLADAQALASTEYRDRCKAISIEDLSDTPFGDLTLGEGRGRTTPADLPKSAPASYAGTSAKCHYDEEIALIHMTGPEGSLQVDMTAWLLFTVSPTCVSSVQVVDGSCTWYGTSVECAGTSATLGLVSN